MLLSTMGGILAINCIQFSGVSAGSIKSGSGPEVLEVKYF
jgi:hypothetical protein